MPSEQQRLARNINEGIETADGCCAAYLLILFFFVGPLFAVPIWAIIAGATGCEWGALIVVALVFITVFVQLIRAVYRH